MPRNAKGARLWLRPGGRASDGRVRAAAWYIRDGNRMRATGCGAGDRDGAEKALAEWIAAKHDPRPAPGRVVDTADIVNLYLREVAPRHARPHETAGRAVFLLSHFAGRPAGEIRPADCRAYAAGRGSEAAARRELEDLRAAFRFWESEGHPPTGAALWIPPAAPPRERWLTRAEAARLLWALWRAREAQDGRPTARFTARHTARFVLVALYTGSRAGVILRARMAPVEGEPWVDAARGVFHRLGAGERETKKRRPPVRIHPRLLAHIRRWARLGIASEWLIERAGGGVARVSKSFRAGAAAAGLDGVTPHILRHTTATWMMQGGANPWEAGGALGMSTETLERRYGHHHPDHLAGALAALARGGRPQK